MAASSRPTRYLYQVVEPTTTVNALHPDYTDQSPLASSLSLLSKEIENVSSVSIRPDHVYTSQEIRTDRPTDRLDSASYVYSNSKLQDQLLANEFPLSDGSSQTSTESQSTTGEDLDPTASEQSDCVVAIATADDESSKEDPWAKLFCLCLDGGGIRGYLTLLILQALETKIAELEQDRDQSQEAEDLAAGFSMPYGKVLLCWYFDVMAGTSTGGLISILLGRLRQPVSVALKKYRKFGEQIFGNPKGGTESPSWKKDSQQIAILRSYTPRSKTHAHDDSQAPRPIQTITIREAGQATSSAPSFFRPTKTSEGGTFVDGAVLPGVNNPSRATHAEIKHQGLSIHTLVNVTTGKKSHQEPTRKSKSKDFFLSLIDLELRQLFQSTLDRHTSSEQSWNEFVAEVEMLYPDSESRPRLLRFGSRVELDIPLDEYKKMKTKSTWSIFSSKPVAAELEKTQVIGDEPEDSATLQKIEAAAKQHLQEEDVARDIKNLAIQLVETRRSRARANREDANRFHSGEAASESGS
ncbi:FabD/lysophospholipase-like protein [Ascobolus immersus RN42]|uniref:FabD/lysophospholipase-like protein n=1 Tax=Ascobolus immersus RN42 TaxID=1160509 RepID=A0A3N4J0N4_ASCIM|nr:FabD/lysophospholipase-like protein [Ascobolus immersus RN42]